MFEPPVFTIPELARLEEIVCPRCGGSGFVGLGVGHGTNPESQIGSAVCNVCSGARRVWRVRPEESPA